MVYLLLYGGNQTQLLIGGSLLASKKAPPNKVKTPYRDADEIMQCYYSIMLSVLNHRKRSINIYIYTISNITLFLYCSTISLSRGSISDAPGFFTPSGPLLRIDRDGCDGCDGFQPCPWASEDDKPELNKPKYGFNNVQLDVTNQEKGNVYRNYSNMFF